VTQVRKEFKEFKVTLVLKANKVFRVHKEFRV
jgi:hypothetical protein